MGASSAHQRAVADVSAAFTSRPCVDSTCVPGKHIDAAEGFFGSNRDIRPLLDYTYHERYSAERIAIQDRIIDKLFPAPSCSEEQPWVVFTAGAMGAGKGFVTRWMHEHGVWDLERFVKVDPDEVRHELPEWEHYVKTNPWTAGDRTQKEAGFVAEIMGYKALRARRSIIVDGSLRNADWYRGYFAKLRSSFPGIRIMILHVVADLRDVIEHAVQRARATGRSVPTERLISSAREVPVSVSSLAPHADFVCRVLNRPGRHPFIVRESGAPHPPHSVAVTWDLVRGLWKHDGTTRTRGLTLRDLRLAIASGLLTQRVIETLRRSNSGHVPTKVERCALTAFAQMPRHRMASI